MKKSKLTGAERATLEIIRKHPFTTQRELANRLGIARTTVATYVDRLHSKGYLLGRAYVLAEDPVVCCFGGATMDRTFTLQQQAIAGTSNPATGSLRRGGVARNVAENLVRLGANSTLISVVGDDDAGENIIEATRREGVDISAVSVLTQHPTGSYSAILQPDGELFIGVADLNICETLDRTLIDRHWSRMAAASLVFADTNAPAETLNYLIERCRRQNVPLCVDTVSVPKARRLPADLTGVEILFCNVAEARALLEMEGATTEHLAVRLCGRGAAHVVVTAGADGLCHANREGCTTLPARPAKVIDVTGAGDALIAGTLCGWLRGQTPLESCKLGLEAASLTTQSLGPGCPALAAGALVSAFAD